VKTTFQRGRRPDEVNRELRETRETILKRISRINAKKPDEGRQGENKSKNEGRGEVVR
jgi:hypothetical protein